MIPVIVALVSWVVTAIPCAKADIYTGLMQFRQVLHSEDTIASHLFEHIQHEQERLEKLREIAIDYQKHSQKSLNNIDNYLGNPLNAFLLIKRFTSDWEKVKMIIENTEASQAFLTNLTNAIPAMPTEIDLIGSGKGLLRLQDTYALDTADVARGDITGVVDKDPLKGDDCFELGRIAYNDGDYYHAVLWMQQALDLFKAEDADASDIALTLDYLSFSVYQQGNTQRAVNLTHEWKQYDPLNPRVDHNLVGYANKMREDRLAEDPTVLRNPRHLTGYRNSPEFFEYEALCRGEKTKENPYASQVSCFYNKEHPFFWLRPLKQEVMYLDPYISIYHDLITDTEVNRIKEIATPMLHTSMLFKHKDPQQRSTDDIRVSMSAWVRDEEDDIVARLSKKVQFAVGLSVKESEAMQVLNYGIGGHYEPHYDFSKGDEDNSDLPDFVAWGNRISTSLYYMTDVAAGGYTVFPVLGVAVPPEKGQMVHWLNLKKSGEGDWNTKHAGCPVLTGTKWVCNKWIHERGQEFRRPCGLNPED